MRTLITADFSKNILEDSVVTIGNFDGVHLGHRQIFQRVCSYAAACSIASVVVTFDPHPLQLLKPESAPLMITTTDQKRSLIAESGLDLMLVIPFTLDFANISAEFFVRDILCKSLGMRMLVIGHDYAFGRNREGNELLLARLASELGFGVEALDPVGDGDLVFSSSEVRRLVLSGEVASVVNLLGRCHRISGQVVHGREIGRSIGFPTANIKSSNQLIPADGVYAVWVEVMGELHQGACSIGVNPTFGGSGRSIEVFLFDFSEELYESEVSVHFAARLRGVIRFPTVCALTEQIAKDIASARNILAAGLPVRKDI